MYCAKKLEICMLSIRASRKIRALICFPINFHVINLYLLVEEKKKMRLI